MDICIFNFIAFTLLAALSNVFYHHLGNNSIHKSNPDMVIYRKEGTIVDMKTGSSKTQMGPRISN